MTEEEWLAGGHPLDMLGVAEQSASDRKLYLFLAASCRLPALAHELEVLNLSDLVDFLERAADGAIGWDEVATRAARFQRLGRTGHQSNPRRQSKRHQMQAALDRLQSPAPPQATAGFLLEAANLLGRAVTGRFHEVFGNPFRPALIDPFWLAWNDGTIGKLATAIDNDRGFERVPILADALEDAGCDDTEVLEHCRAGMEHVRGCWVIDAILGKS